MKILRQLKHGLRAFRRSSRREETPQKLLRLDSGVLVSFVHAYQDEVVTPENDPMPALWRHRDGKDEIARFSFPRTPAEFQSLPLELAGDRPSLRTAPLAKLPRFGLMGMYQARGKLYAGSWNGVYEIDPVSLSTDRFITNKLMCDLHGITADDEFLYTCLTCRDTLVISDFDGAVVDTFSIARDLSVIDDPLLASEDWRFVSKQVRGSVGLFHFNHVQRFGDEVYLTSRNLGCFVVLNMRTRKCFLRPMNSKSPLLIHDGIARNGNYVFTSIDGKVVVAEDGEQSGGIYKRDLVVSKEIKNSRGVPIGAGEIDVSDDNIILANVDGRYGEGTSFGVQGVNFAGEYLGEIRLEYARAGFLYPILYMTGFDLLTESHSGMSRAA